MLPHAVDDNCRAVGTFWTVVSIAPAPHGWRKWLGSIISSPAKGISQNDLPLLSGAFETYWSMAEEAADGSLHFPVSVSPNSKEPAMMPGVQMRVSSWRPVTFGANLTPAANLLEVSTDNVGVGQKNSRLQQQGACIREYPE